MHLSLGCIRVTIKYTYPRGNTTIYHRAIPTDLRGRYPGKTFKLDLKSSDPAQVARKATELTRRLETEWAALRASPDTSHESLKVHGAEFLRSWGLRPAPAQNDDLAVSLLHDHLDVKRERHADGDELIYREADGTEYLSPVEIEALRQLHQSKAADRITDAVELHIASNGKADDEKFVTYARRAVASLTAVTGDKAIREFTREDARRFISASLAGNLKTGTVRRRINSYRAIWETYRLEREHQLPNPFEGLAIPGEGKDAKRRVPFTHPELVRLVEACRAKNDQPRWILGILAETGARIAEVVGAALDDLALDAKVPHLVIRPHPWRTLKNSSSARKVPLVGVALWAAQRIKETATEGQRFAFPRYTNERGCQATHASNAVNKWIRSLGMEHTSHELRHTMADRLRAVQCAKDIRYAIDGHARQDEGDGYGEGYDLKVKVEWLLKVALPS
jgi:integrase